MANPRTAPRMRVTTWVIQPRLGSDLGKNVLLRHIIYYLHTGDYHRLDQARQTYRKRASVISDTVTKHSSKLAIGYRYDSSLHSLPLYRYYLPLYNPSP
jgi:hypothetical protein